MAIEAVAPEIVVIKEMHTVVLIKDRSAPRQITSLYSVESACVRIVIKPNIPISLVIIAPSIQGVAALILNKTRFHRSPTDRGGRHIGEIVTTAIHEVRTKKLVMLASLLSAKMLGSACKNRDREGAFVMKHLSFGGDHGPVYECGSV